MTDIQAKIGYILANEMGEDTFIGGLLVTDQKGFPIEFRYTDPVTPSALQRVIYGNALDRYLIVEVIARSLIESVTDKPDLFITNSRLILELNDLLTPIAMRFTTIDDSNLLTGIGISKLYFLIGGDVLGI